MSRDEHGPYRCYKDVGHRCLRYISDEKFLGATSSKSDRRIFLYLEPWRVPTDKQKVVWFSFSLISLNKYSECKDDYIVRTRDIDLNLPLITVCLRQSVHSQTVRYDDMNIRTEHNNNEQAGSIYLPSELADEPPAEAISITIHWKIPGDNS